MSKIGLIDIDSKIPNLALMKLSQWHKAQGDEVELYMPLWNYDKVYASKVFNFSIMPELPERVIMGGTGFDLTSALPDEVEAIYPDYNLYRCDYAIGFITRGCIRKCSFCVVPQKEGKIKKVADISSFWNGQDRIMLLDNNLTAHPDCLAILKELRLTGARIDFSQGLDLRLMKPEIAKELSGVRLWKQIHFAWDDIRLEKAVFNGLRILTENGVKKYKIMVYILIGFDSTHEENYHRVMRLKEYGVDPFVMPYDKNDDYQADFARWVNMKAVFKTVSWEDYRYRKFA